ncbi:MAG: Hsp20/alpha crystallin family protein [Minisyncoccota bacterium]
MFTLTNKDKEPGKRSFFERLTGTIHLEDQPTDEAPQPAFPASSRNNFPGLRNPQTATSLAPGGPGPTRETREKEWIAEETEEGQLAVDVYQTDKEIVIQAMVAGVSPDTLNVTVTREMVTIKGRRDTPQNIGDDNYFYRELYWGAFSRTLALPQEIEADAVEASQKHGLLTIKLPKIDKRRTQSIRVKQG